VRGPVTAPAAMLAACPAWPSGSAGVFPHLRRRRCPMTAASQSTRREEAFSAFLGMNSRKRGSSRPRKVRIARTSLSYSQARPAGNTSSRIPRWCSNGFKRFQGSIALPQLKPRCRQNGRNSHVGEGHRRLLVKVRRTSRPRNSSELPIGLPPPSPSPQPVAPP
jgi:hypothetical protein